MEAFLDLDKYFFGVDTSRLVHEELFMESIEITTMSSRGQIVIPQGIRDHLTLGKGGKFLVLGEKDTIILKRIETPSVDDVHSLLTQTRQAVQKRKFKKSDLNKILAQERKKS